ncbi:DUF6233 domain-containing protein [Streptomyces sp. NPDC060000]|uniref:DUF6233 domain-containing protein n=1 Tax=Streptomyces sp. NPDC060000 TaxID=3347031 RepID=UPI0036B6F2E4
MQQRQAETEQGRRRRPQPPQWTVELGIGAGRPPIQVHAGDCHMAGERRRPVGRDEARRLLAGGLRPCAHCRPDTQLDIPGLPRGTTPAPVPCRKDTSTMSTSAPRLRSQTLTRPRSPVWAARSALVPPASKTPKYGHGGSPLCQWCLAHVLEGWGPTARFTSTRA